MPVVQTNMEMSSEMKMAEDTMKRLTDKLLVQILARLPMKSIMRFRAVCKRWNEMFQSLEFRQLTSSMAVSATPAFLLGWGMEPSRFLRKLWISTESSYKFHTLSLEFLPSPVIILARCKSLLCCSGEDGIYICNPVTKTWIELPKRPEQFEYSTVDFISLAFDTCATCCTPIMGRNSSGDNGIVVEMYDSKCNKWTHSEIPAGNLIRPRGEGVYSNGKYYWLNDVHNGESLSLVTLEVQQKQWNTIEGPPSLRTELLLKRGILVQHHVKVTGCEEHIVVVCEFIWTLHADEVEAEEWSKSFDDEFVMTTTDIAVNESGCRLAFDFDLLASITVRSDKGKLLQKIGFSELADISLSQYNHSLMSVLAFQVNNIWWP